MLTPQFTRKMIIVLLILSFLCLYMEWGNNQHAYVFQAIQQLFSKQSRTTNTFTHPLIALPCVGILLLLFCLFAKNYPKWVFALSIGLLGVLVLIILLVGILSANGFMLISPISFIILVVMYYWLQKRN